MSIRAKERLYLKSSVLYREKDQPIESTLFCKPGDEISSSNVTTYRAYLESFGFIPMSEAKIAYMQIQCIKVRHSDALGTQTIVLPSRSEIQDISVICQEAAAGSPDIDFGEFGGDVDGILDGLGQLDICDTLAACIDTGADFKGRGDLITGIKNEDSKRTKIRKYYADGVTLTNTQNSAGTAGEWLINIMYLVYPEVS